MGKIIKDLVIEKVLEYGYIVTFSLLSELLNFFHPVTGTKGFLGLLIDKFLNGAELYIDLLNPCVEVFIFTMFLDFWILVFFNFRDIFRNRRVIDAANWKTTSDTFKLGCFHISAVVRCIVLLVILNFFDAKYLKDTFSIPLGISLVVSFALLSISLGGLALVAPAPGGAKTKAVFKVIKGVVFLTASAIGLFPGGFVVMNLLTNDVAEEKPGESTVVEDTPVAVTSNGIFVGTRNGKDFYLLPETFSGDNEKFHVTAEYIDKSANHKDQIVFYFVHYRTGWIYYDSSDETAKRHVNKLRDGDVVKKSGIIIRKVRQNKLLCRRNRNIATRKNAKTVVWFGRTT